MEWTAWSDNHRERGASRSTYNHVIIVCAIYGQSDQILRTQSADYKMLLQ